MLVAGRVRVDVAERSRPDLMYSACLWCHARLGTNDQVPTFPVGGRLAFDPEREAFVGSEPSPAWLTRKYRPGHWAVPPGV